MPGLMPYDVATEDGDAYHVGALVWVPHVEGVDARGASDMLYATKKKVKRWVPGRVMEVKVVVDDPDSPQLTINVDEEDMPLTGMHISECPLRNERDDTVDDLVKSDFLHEPGLLNTLKVRYSLDLIYTYSANILIACNPHKRLRTLYGSKMMRQYKDKQLGELSPHVYAIAEQAFSYMMMDEQKQAILISGESGAGKTENAKMVMQFLASRGQVPKGHQVFAASPRRGRSASLTRNAEGNIVLNEAEDPDKTSAPIEEQVLESNPLLEAFGNAKTSRNDNSSRFGKFVEMYFDVWGRVTGASINTYLLERSRVVSIASPERSYHVFYQLVAGADPELRKQLRLGNNPRDFRYLAQSDVFELNHIDDAEDFRRTLDAMHIIGLSEEAIDGVLRAVAAVLHLGNVTFKQQDYDTATFNGAAAEAEIKITAELLGISEEGLRQTLLTRRIQTVGESITKNLDLTAATEARDSLAKNIYAKLFDWLVMAINRKIFTIGSGRKTGRSIGILDIYGFESFKDNSFEQLCINLANERLQQQFNGHVFKGEQEEYEAEGIDWSYVDFIDNQECLDLLEGLPDNQSLGVFPLIDEACRMPRATFEGLAHALRTRLENVKRFEAPKRPQHAFIIDHYAGKVSYSTQFLLEKNKDFVVADQAALLETSSNPIVAAMFALPRELEGQLAPAADGEEPPAPGKVKHVVRSSFKFNSVGLQFRKQLAGLMNTLNECHPHYIRCIKPNPESRPGNLVPEYVLEQLRAGGVLEAVRIACAGFPTRKEFVPFAQRYALLIGEGKYQPTDWEMQEEEAVVSACRRALQSVKLQGWQVGKSRVFLRAGQLAQLEGARGRKVTKSAIVIQAAWRQHATRQWYKQTIQRLVRLQAVWRGAKAREHVMVLRRERAALRVQTAYRMHKERSKFVAWRRNKAATTIQAYVRMVQQRDKFRRDTEAGKRAAERAEQKRREERAAVRIQSGWRAVGAKRQLAVLRAEAAKWKLVTQERDAYQDEASMWRQRFEAAERRCQELEAASTRLETELQSATVQAQAAASVAAVETAELAAKAATAAELDLLRQQKAEGETLLAATQEQVREVSNALKSREEELAAAREVQAKKDEDHARALQEAMAATSHLYTQLAARDHEIAGLEATLEDVRGQAQLEVAAVTAALQAEMSRAKLEAEERIRQLDAQLLDKSNALAEVQDNNTQLNARLLAMRSQVDKLERTAQERDLLMRSQQEEVQRITARGALATAAAVAEPNGDELNLPHIHLGGESADAEPAMGLPETLEPDAYAISEFAGLSREHEEVLAVLARGAVEKRLQVVNIQHGPKASDAIGMPVASWILGECLLRWAARWTHTEMDIVAIRLKTTIMSNATDLQLQAYWLSASLALGAFLRVRSIGKRDVGNMFKFGDDMINFTGLHAMLGDSIADMVVVDVTVLLGQAAKKSRVSRNGTPRAADKEAASRHLDALMTSPWKGLLGALSNVIESLRGEGTPAAAVRAVVHATLSFINAELFNALLLRRDCCSISSVKALQNGLNDLKAWFGFMGCGDAMDVERAFEHVNQAVRYLLIGKDDCVRKAAKGFDVMGDLKRLCPKLTVNQVYRLTEQHHDDWIAGLPGSASNQTIILLDLLRRHIDDRMEPPSSPSSSTSGLSMASTVRKPEEEDGLLLEPLAQFVLPKRLLTEAARQFVQAPRGAGHGPGLSLLEKIEKSCRTVPLPRQLRNNAEFAFLSAI